tara:strand:- start:371 stop:1066 length:696 start_codon:yes stop_codon:yes gene_type:complete
MVDVVAQTWAGAKTCQLLLPSRADPSTAFLDLQPLLDSGSRANQGRPVLMMATTLALDMLRSQWPEGRSIRLPAGSRLMDTGGPKGRALDVSREDQHRWLCAHLGLEPHAIVGELGMTELGSQRYETVLRAHLIGDCESSSSFAGPPWLRSVALSAVDLKPLPAGQVGMLAHIDLANFEPCAFVLTADKGRVVQTNSTDRVELMGRVPGSDWRGCGLDVEQLLSDSTMRDL